MRAAEEGEFVGARLDAGLQAVRFASPPSADKFAAEVEPMNVPAVIHLPPVCSRRFFPLLLSDIDVFPCGMLVGLPRRGQGMGRLLPVGSSPRRTRLLAGFQLSISPPSSSFISFEKVGRDVAVEAMMSNSGRVFYGDLRSHERVSIPFSTFIQSCKSYLHVNAASGSSIEQTVLEESACSRETSSGSSDHNEQVYLAQASSLPAPFVSILNTERNGRCSLEILKEDIQEPIFLRGKSFSSINFWMNRAHLRSSTHYDPHHNLLCVVAGCKKVTLWPPSASPFLYPMPVYGEASNHSSVSIEEPDYSSYARAIHMKEYSERVVLNRGDVLFIPEG
ncbi:hypothetical protein EJB05_16795, partial [Eragrostis curvula]